jgi:uncharacterized protein (TIGR02246 family)
MLSLSHVGVIGALIVASATQTTSDDERVIRAMVDQAVSRLNKGDVTALDDFWDEAADYVGVDGTLIRGRAAIQGMLRRMANSGGSQQSVTVEQVRFVTPEMATVDDRGRSSAHAMRKERKELAPIKAEASSLFKRKTDAGDSLRPERW